jgi:probable rRNA maturation factor
LEKQPEIKVDVEIDAAFEERVGVEPLRRAALAAVRHEKVTAPAELTVVVTSDARVRRLNRTYRGLDRTTDVLAFGGSAGGTLVVPAGAVPYIGDVIISLPRAAAQAKDAGHSLEAELQLLTVHGVLHLLDHDHAEPQDKAAMWSAQTEILRGIGAPVRDPNPNLAE